MIVLRPSSILLLVIGSTVPAATATGLADNYTTVTAVSDARIALPIDIDRHADGLDIVNSITSRKLQSSTNYIIIGNDVNQDNQLLVNNGGGSFTAQTLAGGGRSTHSIAVADFNKDGFEDVVVGNNGPNTNSQLLINNGDGTFTASDLQNGDPSTTSIATGDFNNDGWMDIIIGNDAEVNPDANQILINAADGSGSFLPAVDLAGGLTRTFSITTAFIDGDDYLDIIVGNINGNQPDQVLINNGDLTFTASDLPGFNTFTRSLVAADVDNDGDIDIIIGNDSAGIGNKLLLNDGTGSFTSSILEGAGYETFGFNTFGITTGFINDDSYIDIIVGNANAQPNELLLNNADGTGTFTSWTLPGAEENTISVAVADVNGDGLNDIIIGNSGGQDNQLLINNGPGLVTQDFSDSILPGGIFNTKSIIVADIVTGTAPDGPWDITFNGQTTDFSATSNKELTLDYLIGKGREYFSPTLLMEDCTTAVSGVSITQDTPTRAPSDASYDTLTLAYDFDKSTIAGSLIWDASTSELKVCQVVQLVEQGMVIAEDQRLVTITFNLESEFSIQPITLAEEADAVAVAAGADVNSYVEAYKCGGAGVMTVNTIPLAPNEDLFVCVRSTSADVEIQSLDELDIGGTTLEVINGGVISFPAFTSINEVSATARQVLTRVPANLFDYNAQDASITITGSVTMKLSGSGRMLRTDFEAKNVFDGTSNEQAAEFEVNVGLKPAEITIKDKTSLLNSSTAASVGVKAYIAIGMVIASISAMW